MGSLLQVEGVTKSFGNLVLFENLSLAIDERQRIGLIAKNGTGKTTLLNIIAGKEDYEAGSISRKKDLKVAYLEQNPMLPKGMTVMQACLGGESPALQAIERYEKALQQNDETALSEAIGQIDRLNGWNYEAKIKEILSKLKIRETETLTDHLSGGQVKRIALANALILEPDLLILDEPTNHLDLSMTEWLENYLSNANISLLMVTHDRYFLDRVCTDIVEIDAKKLYSYKGNYSFYLEKRQERHEAIQSQREKHQNLYKKELEWMRRQPQARATKAKARIESFGELEQRLKSERSSRNLQLDVKAAYIGKKIFEALHISKRFGDKVILDDFNYVFSRYEKLGIIGENGTGKSTFIKMLLGKVPTDSGSFDIGETVRFGYYAQEGITFKETDKVIDIITNIAENIDLSDGRKMSASQFLQYFLFQPEKQYDFVGKLSGGERRRLYLCSILMTNPNFLVLDEPTNDLDITTLQVLENYLESFSGCLIVVSHDRYFIDKVADHLFVFEGDGRIKDFPSGYSDYLQWNSLKEQEKPKADKPVKVKTPAGHYPESSDGITSKSEPRAKTKLSFKEKRELEELETRIPELEQEKAHLEALLSSGELNVDELNTQSLQISEIIEQLDEMSFRWLELSEFES